MERLGGSGWSVRQQRTVRKAREQYWPGTLMAFGLITFIATFWTGQLVTLITFSAMFRWLALFAFAGNLLPYMRSGLVLGMERFEWFLFNLLAVGPFVFSGLLWANFLFRGAPVAYVMRGDPTRQEFLAHWRSAGELLPGRTLEGLSAQLTPEERLKGYVLGPVLWLAPGALGYRVIERWEPAQKVPVEVSVR